MPLNFLSRPTASHPAYTLSLHDALPILRPSDSSCRKFPTRSVVLVPSQRGEDARPQRADIHRLISECGKRGEETALEDRKSTRLNSSHSSSSYAVYCLKKKLWSLSPRRR